MRANHSARFVGPLERILFLKSLPNFASLPGEDLAAMAQFVDERRFTRGQVLQGDDRPVDAVYFVVEGRLRVDYHGVPVAVVETPWGAGFLGLMSREPAGTLIVAETDALTLELHAEIIIDLLEDHFGLLQAGLRQLSKQLVTAQSRLPSATSKPPVGEPYPQRPLDLVERLVWMRQNAKPFRNSNLDALAGLQRSSLELRMDPGETLWRVGDEADHSISIVYGNVRVENGPGQRSYWAGAGFTLGIIEALAEVPRAYDAVTETRMVGLKNDISALLGVIEDNAELGLDMLATQAGMLLEIYSKVGPVTAES